MDELLGDGDSVSSSPAPTATEEQPASSALSAARDVTAILGDATSDAPKSSASEAFGARLDSSFGSSVSQDTGSKQNWMLIAACVAVLVAALGAGIAYFRQRPANANASSRTAPVAQSASNAAQPGANDTNQLPAITPAGQPYMPAGAQPNSAARSNASAPTESALSSNASNATKAPAPSANHSPAAPAAKQQAPGVTSDMVSTALTSRPTTWTRGSENQADQAPVLDASASAAGASALPGIAAPNAASLPAPTMQPEGPVKIGGNVKAPKLINSVAPIYPPSARSSGVQGDVIIDTTIDKAGKDRENARGIRPLDATRICLGLAETLEIRAFQSERRTGRCSDADYDQVPALTGKSTLLNARNLGAARTLPRCCFFTSAGIQ